MLQTITMLRQTRADMSATLRLCKAFGLTDEQTTRVIDDLLGRGFF